jgi:transcriptional regulator with XRE-family HTH domain
MGLPSDDFARAFGDDLKRFLDKQGITYAKAAGRLGITKAALSTYWSDDKDGKRRKARVELLYRACVELGFEFEYRGHRIAAKPLGRSKPSQKSPAEQLLLDFSRQFKLTEDDGLVSVRLERHPGRVELSVSLKAAS